MKGFLLSGWVYVIVVIIALVLASGLTFGLMDLLEPKVNVFRVPNQGNFVVQSVDVYAPTWLNPEARVRIWFVRGNEAESLWLPASKVLVIVGAENRVIFSGPSVPIQVQLKEDFVKGHLGDNIIVPYSIALVIFFVIGFLAGSTIIDFWRKKFTEKNEVVGSIVSIC